MELVSIIYKFLLFGGGLLFLVLFGSFLASRMLKSGNNNLASRQQNKVTFNERQIDYMYQKEQIFLNKNNGNGEYRKSSTAPEVKEVRVVRRSQTERPTKSTRYSRERRTGDNKQRFSIVNEKFNTIEQSNYKSKVENEFRFFLSTESF